MSYRNAAASPQSTVDIRFRQGIAFRFPRAGACNTCLLLPHLLTVETRLDPYPARGGSLAWPT
jgi:hypothetical protein